MKSLLNWNGNKRRIADWIEIQMLPILQNDSINTLVDPFFGSGWMSFTLLKHGLVNKVIATDLNADIVNFWNVIARSDLLDEYIELEQMYYEWQEADYITAHNKAKEDWYKPSSLSVKAAARFRFLNKMSFASIYAVDKEGRFSSSVGHYNYQVKGFRSYPKTKIKDLELAHELMQKVTLTNASYDTINVPNNAVVYLDPPYMPHCATGKKPIKYTDYGVGNFDFEFFWKWSNSLALNNSVYLSHVVPPYIQSSVPALRYSAVENLRHTGGGKGSSSPMRVEALYSNKPLSELKL